MRREKAFTWAFFLCTTGNITSWQILYNMYCWYITYALSTEPSLNLCSTKVSKPRIPSVSAVALQSFLKFYGFLVFCFTCSLLKKVPAVTLHALRNIEVIGKLCGNPGLVSLLIPLRKLSRLCGWITWVLMLREMNRELKVCRKSIISLLCI